MQSPELEEDELEEEPPEEELEEDPPEELDELEEEPPEDEEELVPDSQQPIEQICPVSQSELFKQVLSQQTISVFINIERFIGAETLSTDLFKIAKSKKVSWSK